MIDRQKELIRLVQNGNKVAFERLKEELKKPVISRLTSWVKKGDLDDILKVTWLKLELEIHQYNPVIEPLIFVLSIADKEAKELFAKKKKGDLYLEDFKQQIKSNSEDHDPGLSLSKKELGREINQFYIHLLKLIITKGGYPHKIIAYMFCKIIYPCSEDGNIYKNSSRKKDARVSGYPGKVVAEIFDKYLSKLSVQLEKSYLHYSSLPHKEIVPVFAYLHQDMKKLLRDILDTKVDSFTWNIIEQKRLLEQSVGKTFIRQYCDDKSDDNRLAALVSYWCDKLQKKVRANFFKDPDWRIYFKVLKEVFNLRLNNPKLFYEYIGAFMNNPINRR